MMTRMQDIAQVVNVNFKNSLPLIKDLWSVYKYPVPEQITSTLVLTLVLQNVVEVWATLTRLSRKKYFKFSRRK